jgi:hypothetical protein
VAVGVGVPVGAPFIAICPPVGTAATNGLIATISTVSEAANL